jgi:ABC-2 type transport system ATP-binding protein
VLEALREAGITFKDLHTSQSSLEEIFVGLVNQPASKPVQGAAI